MQSIERVFTGEAVRVGRHPDFNDLILNNGAISKNHLIIKQEEGRIFIEDLGSNNGTFIMPSAGSSILSVSGQIGVENPCIINVAQKVILKTRLGPAKPSTGENTILEDSYSEERMLSIQAKERFGSIMVLDLCGSSRLANHNENMAYHIKKRLESITKRILLSMNYDFYKNTGDGFLCTFQRPDLSVKAAQVMINKLVERNQRSPNPPINVRIALHYGRIYVLDPETQDIHGNDVNITFRIEGVTTEAFNQNVSDLLPKENRIICSEVFLEEWKKTIRESDISTVLLGSANLKGIKENLKLFLIEP